MDNRDWNTDNQDRVEIAGGVLIGIVLAAIVAWVIVSTSSGTKDIGSARLSGAQASAAPNRSAPDKMRRCIDAEAAMRLPLRHAASSLSQWEVHVGAMNKLVVGAITLGQANAFWNQTRLGAHHHIAEFDRAWAHLQREGVDCPAPPMLPARAPRELRACAREVAADVRALQVARSAIDTWRGHVRAMEMLRLGKMSPATANQMWLAMWHRGQHQIDAYRSAIGAARGGSGCPSETTAAFGSRSH